MAKIDIIISVADSGGITIDIQGPIKNRDQALQVLDAAKKLIRQSKEFDSAPVQAP